MKSPPLPIAPPCWSPACCIVGVTLPPWPGEGEAVAVPGTWRPTLPR